MQRHVFMVAQALAISFVCCGLYGCKESDGKDVKESPLEAPGGALKVMSYNTLYTGYPKHGGDKLDSYAAKIKEVDPDIVGIQECSQPSELAQAAGIPMLSGTNNEQTIFSQLTVVDSGKFHGNFKRNGGYIAWGKFAFGRTNIWFFNMHLPHNKHETTPAALGKLWDEKLSSLGASSEPSIAVGDFNSGEAFGQEFREYLKSHGFTLAYTGTGSKGGFRRFDNILFSTPHWTKQHCQDDGTGGSDHPAISCDLLLKV